LAKYFIDPKTREKIHIYGGGFEGDLREIIDDENLPENLGGSLVPDYEDPKSCWGPWDKYCDYCKKKGTFFHFGQEFSDP
jgi:hypothetical protein